VLLGLGWAVWLCGVGCGLWVVGIGYWVLGMVMIVGTTLRAAEGGVTPACARSSAVTRSVQPVFPST